MRVATQQSFRANEFCLRLSSGPCSPKAYLPNRLQHFTYRLLHPIPPPSSPRTTEAHLRDILVAKSESPTTGDYSYTTRPVVTAIQTVRIRCRPQLARQQTILTRHHDRRSGCVGAQTEQQRQARPARRSGCWKGKHSRPNEPTLQHQTDKPAILVFISTALR